jgi:hypothetical protein
MAGMAAAPPPHGDAHRHASDLEAARQTEDAAARGKRRKAAGVACQTAVAWSELVCRAQVAREKQRGVALAAALEVGVVQREVEEAQQLVSRLSAALTAQLPQQHAELARTQTMATQVLAARMPYARLRVMSSVCVCVCARARARACVRSCVCVRVIKGAVQ